MAQDQTAAPANAGHAAGVWKQPGEIDMTARLDTSEDRLERLETAKGFALEYRFDEALVLIAALRRELPMDVEVLRLLGNVLELRAFDVAERGRGKLIRSADYMAARQYYEQILQQDPHNCMAIIDLGDHYANLDAFDRAFSYYWKAFELLGNDGDRVARRAALEEMIAACDNLLREEQAVTRAAQLKTACEELLKKE